MRLKAVMTAAAALLAQNAFAQAPASDIVPMPVLSAAGTPGVVTKGSKVEIVKGGFKGTEGVIGQADGSMLFCEPRVRTR